MEVLEAIRTRRSVRAYANRPIPPEVMQRLRQALRSAPSACNIQPWHFILVTDAGLRRDVARIANDQDWMAGAPLTVVACGFPRDAYQTMGGRTNSVDIDVAIALDHLSLAAMAEGLGTCWIGAFDEGQLKAFLDVPDELRIVALMPVGYPAEASLLREIADEERKPETELFSANQYGKR